MKHDLFGFVLFLAGVVALFSFAHLAVLVGNALAAQMLKAAL